MWSIQVADEPVGMEGLMRSSKCYVSQLSLSLQVFGSKNYSNEGLGDLTKRHGDLGQPLLLPQLFSLPWQMLGFPSGFIFLTFQNNRTVKNTYEHLTYPHPLQLGVPVERSSDQWHANREV